MSDSDQPASSFAAADPSQEAGTASQEAGTAPREAGTASREAGTASREAGTASREAGTAPRNLRSLYYKHFGDCKKERRLFATGSFFATFVAVRGVTHAIRAERGPFKNITPGGRHIHHMTFGIAGLLSVGYLWMLEIGINEERWSSRATAFAFGSGAALTLDEFALWLNLEDVYWAKQGRESIDAVVVFGSLLGISSLGKGFFAELVKGRRLR